MSRIKLTYYKIKLINYNKNLSSTRIWTYEVAMISQMMKT